MTFAGFITSCPLNQVGHWPSSSWYGPAPMGVGSANLLTDKAVDMMDSGYSMVTQPTAPSTRSAARGIFEMNLCKYAINRELESLYADGVANTPLITTKGATANTTPATAARSVVLPKHPIRAAPGPGTCCLTVTWTRVG